MNVEMNPKDSYVYRIDRGIAHATQKGSNNLLKNIFYKHVIPSGLMNVEMNPKDSYVYRKKMGFYYSTPKGSHIASYMNSYKNVIPSRLINNDNKETE